MYRELLCIILALAKLQCTLMIALNLDDVTLFERSNEQNFVLDTI